LEFYPQKDAEINFNHTVKQAYTAFGHAIIAAAFEEVDATPIEGFVPAKVDEILGLREKGLRSGQNVLTSRHLFLEPITSALSGLAIILLQINRHHLQR